jgi:hypothetical protein
MDILLYDEFGQLSAELLKIFDIIFRKIRDSNTSFGGVLIIANMDASQFGPIDGLPILLSSHVLTEFVIITLTESVRAHGDPDFCQIQNISRMSPSLLKGNVGLEYQFKSLCSTCLTFMENWDGVPPNPFECMPDASPHRKPRKNMSMHASVNLILQVHSTVFAIQWILRVPLGLGQRGHRPCRTVP